MSAYDPLTPLGGAQTTGPDDARQKMSTSRRPGANFTSRHGRPASRTTTVVDQSEHHLLGVRSLSIDEVTVLTVHGEIDALTAPLLAEAITRALSGPSTALIVDLSELDFLASAGMTVLLHGNRDAARASKRFGVVAEGPVTGRLMKLLGLDTELSIFESLEAAIDVLR
jgi:anti-anti-sigma factor